MNSYMKAQFSYCPLIWMLHDRYLNAKVNKIHERPLRIVYKDTHADYEALMKLDDAVSAHQRNLQYLMTEIYKTKNSPNPSLMKELFKPRYLLYNLRNKILLIYSTLYGIEPVQFIDLFANWTTMHCNRTGGNIGRRLLHTERT